MARNKSNAFWPVFVLTVLVGAVILFGILVPAWIRQADEQGKWVATIAVGQYKLDQMKADLAARQDQATAEPAVSESDQPENDASVVGQGTFTINGAPSNAQSVLVAEEEFVNTVGLGSEMMLAEPGTILVGPDFHDPQMVEDSPHMDWISPITQQLMGTPTWDTNASEGAFLWATGARMTVQVGPYTIRVDSPNDQCSNNWFVIIRGLFADGLQDSDRNTTAHFSEYVAGHTQVMLYPMGAFISEGNFLQVAEASHTDDRNCGAEGTSGLSVLMLDLNTGAYTVLYQEQLGAPWQLVADNWQ